MSSAVKLNVPTQGEKITISNGRLNVPDSEASFGIPIVAQPRAPCDPPHSGDFRAAYLASLVGVRPNSCLRDVRDKP